MKRYSIVGIVLCLISSSIWPMKRLNGLNGVRGGQAEGTKDNRKFLDHKFLALCMAGSLQPIKNLLMQGADVNVTDGKKRSALHFAAGKGHTAVCELLLDRNVRVNARESQGGTPLHFAAGKGHTAVCKLLLDWNARVDAKTLQGGTPLHSAAFNGHTEVCELLLGCNAPVDAQESQGGTPLHIAAFNGHTEVCALLIGHKAPVDAKDSLGFTPLHIAAQEGHTEVCKLLLGRKASVDAKNSLGFTPLHIAAQEGHTEVCKLLLDWNARVDARSLQDGTPLHIAAQEGHTEVCKLLLGHNAPVDARSSQGGTPLHIAAQEGHKGVCELLIARKAPVDARLNRDLVNNRIPMGEFTPLHLAVYFNQLEVVKFLIAAHADKYACTQDDRTVLDRARQRGHRELETYLETTLEEELPAAGSLPQLATVEEKASPNLLSAVEHADTQRVEHLLEAEGYTADEFRAALIMAKELHYYHMMGLMAAKEPISFEPVVEKVLVS